MNTVIIILRMSRPDDHWTGYGRPFRMQDSASGPMSGS
jgi:hypothetical protein